MKMSHNRMLAFRSANGVEAIHGTLARRPPARELARRARGNFGGLGGQPSLRQDVARERAGWRELVDGRSAQDLAQAGWGIVFSSEEDPAVREALSDLLEFRKEQAGEDMVAVYDGEEGFHTGQNKLQFLHSLKTLPGAADSRSVPYYLALVGGPSKIPFRFQYQLGLRYGVGRLSFDSPEEYHKYGQAVIQSERCARDFERGSLVLFAPANPDDDLTAQSSEILGKLLGERLLENLESDGEVTRVVGDDATKVRLLELLGRKNGPDVLMFAAHGLYFEDGHILQRALQGSWICQEWPGPKHSGSMSDDWYFSAKDLHERLDLTGKILFSYACDSAGSPSPRASSKIHPRSELPFTAALPGRLLSNPGGCASAVVGHVGEILGNSFLWAGLQWTQVYEQALQRLLRGGRLGWSLEPFRRRYAELSSDLYDQLEQEAMGLASEAPDELVGGLWAATEEARSLIVLGDPAVRLCGRGGETQ